ncbi:hypothetical protein ACKKBG_A13655 [Auxenochlorella protothecoides x Auxenochlorella symbiontica]
MPQTRDATKLAARALCASFGSHHPSRLLDDGPIGFLVDDPAGAAPSDDDAGVTDADLSFAPSPPPFETLPLGACLTSSVPSGGEEWRFETGRLARLADGACLLHVGDTSLLATLESQPSRSTWRDPLSRFVVDYRERFAAVGRIPTTYFKREVSAKDHEVLAGRAVQRAMLPLFPPGFPGQLRMTASVLSATPSADLEAMAINAASAAAACSSLPWRGPVGAVRVSVGADGKPALGLSASNPANGEPPRLSLLMAATADQRITMLDVEACQVPEAELIAALRFGAAAAAALVPAQVGLATAAARPPPPAAADAGADPAAAARVAAAAREPVLRALRESELGRETRGAALAAAKAGVLRALRDAGAVRADPVRVPGSGAVSPRDLDLAFAEVTARALRELALQEGVRCDGRGAVDTRRLLATPRFLPVVHGSALMNRGETQALVTATVGGSADAQKTDTLFDAGGSKRLFMQYSLPEYAGDEESETGLRKELEAATFSERALAAVLPSGPSFPFTVRLHADTLAQNGGSTALAVCGACLAMADAGLPLPKLVAGVCVGLLSDASAGPMGDGDQAPGPGARLSRYALLVDPQALEVRHGDMRLNLAGTDEGLTAVSFTATAHGGVLLAVLEEAIALGRASRLQALEDMTAALPKTRPAEAPMVGHVKVHPRMLGRIIGPSGSNLRGIEEATGARVQVQDDGRVHVFGPSAAAYESAAARVLDTAGDSMEEGKVYTAKVVALRDYGAMVEILETRLKALLHISELAATRVRAVEDELALNQTVQVLCLGRDEAGNVVISRKALLAREAGSGEGAAGAGAPKAAGSDGEASPARSPGREAHRSASREGTRPSGREGSSPSRSRTPARDSGPRRRG